MDRRSEELDQRPRLLFVYISSYRAAICSRHFRRLGWIVHLAASREETLAKVHDRSWTAVVIDARNHGEFAQTLAAEIRSVRHGLPVVLWSEATQNGRGPMVPHELGTWRTDELDIDALACRVRQLAALTAV
ncbi:MAG: hypothetical protein NZO58_10080 [Gemmataceae bacterium]|nr:hypothetical protein [Gemmataceae bacterium]